MGKRVRIYNGNKVRKVGKGVGGTFQIEKSFI